jgi:hypothetical protein
MLPVRTGCIKNSVFYPAEVGKIKGYSPFQCDIWLKGQIQNISISDNHANSEQIMTPTSILSFCCREPLSMSSCEFILALLHCMTQALQTVCFLQSVRSKVESVLLIKCRILIWPVLSQQNNPGFEDLVHTVTWSMVRSISWLKWGSLKSGILLIYGKPVR